MCKYGVLFASCLLFGLHLTAAPIETLTITSLSASLTVGGGEVSFTASGPSVGIAGAAGRVNPSPWLVNAGQPFGLALIDLPDSQTSLGLIPPGAGASGEVTIGSTSTLVELFSATPRPGVSGTTNQLVPDTSGSITFPGIATGEYSAVACEPPGEFPNCIGPQIANILLDLPGVFTVNFNGAFSGSDDNEITSVDFTSVPEPAAVLLFFSGLAAILVLRLARQRSKPWRPAGDFL